MQIWESANWPSFQHDSSRTERQLAIVTRRLGEVAGLQAGLDPIERQEMFLRSIAHEAVSSFAIEGAALRADEIEASVVASLAHRDGAVHRRSDAIAELMLEARAGQGALTKDILFRWHNLLFHGIEVEEKGRYRSFPMVIARTNVAGREDVLYRPLPPGRVASEMAVFLDALEQDTRPVPIRAAIAHLWFESIHPFSDGNGRLGRALIEHVFAREAPLPFSLSRQIEKDKRGYYAALQEGRRLVGDHIDATPFVCWLLDRMLSGVDEAERDARFLVRRNAYFLRFPDLSTRSEKVLRRLFAEGPDRVELGISAGPYSKIAGVSLATATRDLAGLERIGALERGPEGGRSTRYRLNLQP